MIAMFGFTVTYNLFKFLVVSKNLFALALSLIPMLLCIAKKQATRSSVDIDCQNMLVVLPWTKHQSLLSYWRSMNVKLRIAFCRTHTLLRASTRINKNKWMCSTNTYNHDLEHKEQYK
jgi:hypothetical protein